MTRRELLTRRAELVFMALMFVFWNAVVIFLATALPGSSHSHEFTATFFVFIGLGLFGCVVIAVSSWLFLLAVTEAAEVSRPSGVIEVSYLHLGRRHLRTATSVIRSIRVRLFRFNLASGFVPAWLLWFGGFQVAVVPRDQFPEPPLVQ